MVKFDYLLSIKQLAILFFSLAVSIMEMPITSFCVDAKFMLFRFHWTASQPVGLSVSPSVCLCACRLVSWIVHSGIQEAIQDSDKQFFHSVCCRSTLFLRTLVLNLSLLNLIHFSTSSLIHSSIESINPLHPYFTFIFYSTLIHLSRLFHLIHTFSSSFIH